MHMRVSVAELVAPVARGNFRRPQIRFGSWTQAYHGRGQHVEADVGG